MQARMGGKAALLAGILDMADVGCYSSSFEICRPLSRRQSALVNPYPCEDQGPVQLVILI